MPGFLTARNAVVGPQGPASTVPAYPRRASYLIGGTQLYDAAYATWAGKRDFNIIGRDLENGSTGLLGGSRLALVTAIKAAAASGCAADCFQYYIPDHLESSPRFPTMAAIAIASNWYLYQNGTSGTVVTHPSNSAWQMLNPTVYVPADSSTGLRCEERHAKFMLDQFINGASADAAANLIGIYRDNIGLVAEKAGDYNRDGTTDAVGEPTPNQWVRDGIATGADWFHANSSKKFIGNMGNAGDPASSSGTVFTGLAGKMDGGLIESLFGKPVISPESYGGFAKAKLIYQFHMGGKYIGSDPYVVVTHAQLAANGSDGLDATPYRAARMSLCFTLMDGGFWSTSQTGAYDFRARNWFDYEAVDPFTGIAATFPAVDSACKYLGYPIDPAWPSPEPNGVYLRRFFNPATTKTWLVMVNPRGNGAQSVNVGTRFAKSFKSITSVSQDTTIDDGGTRSVVSLADRDGRIGMLV